MNTNTFDFNATSLARAGFRDAERAVQNLEGLTDPSVYGQLPDGFLQALTDAPDPDRKSVV